MRVRNKALYRNSKPQGSLAQLAESTLKSDPKVAAIEINGTIKQIKSYSIINASAAIGKSVVQMRSWISKGYVPAPILLVAKCNYRVYDYREMQIIRKHLYRATKRGISYLTKRSLSSIEGLHEEIYQYRRDTYDY